MSLQLTDEQVDEVARIKDIVMAKVRVEVEAMAEMMVSKSNGEFFGATEFVGDHRVAVLPRVASTNHTAQRDHYNVNECTMIRPLHSMVY